MKLSEEEKKSLMTNRMNGLLKPGRRQKVLSITNFGMQLLTVCIMPVIT